MRVLVHQQFHLGHHYIYLSHLLPRLRDIAADVVVALTPAGLKSAEFAAFLEPLVDRITFDPSLPEADTRALMMERWRLHGDLRKTVRRVKPDYVLVPSGDAHATAMSAFNVAGLGAVPGHVPCELGVHFGLGSGAADAKAKVRDRLNQLSLAASGLTRVHFVNHLFYEQICNRGGSLAKRATLMPDPVPASPRLSKLESRRRLGIPEEGRYIGLAASLDSRKAIPEFLAAFRAVGRPSERVLLAGWINGTHLRTIERSFQDLIDSTRLILIQGFQTATVFQTALSALDVVCTPYPRFGGLSSTLLEGVAAGRPVLTNDFGWSAAITNRFQLGWTCDVLSHDAFSRAIRRAFDECDGYRESEATSRLLAFHLPENFAESWLTGLRKAAGLPRARTLLPWTWVLDATRCSRQEAV